MTGGIQMPWLAGGLALLAVLIFTPLVLRWARRRGWLVPTRADRWHRQPVAQGGGIAIYAAATLAVLCLAGGGRALGPVWGGATLLFGLGLADDLSEVRPATKLAVQGLATLPLLFAGHTLLGGAVPLWLSGLATVLWIVGVTNAVNLLDNMDGLAAGVVALAAGVLAATTEAASVAAALLAVAGAAGGFLAFNWRPARLFMGDGGSLFLGYTVAALAVQGQAGGAGGEALPRVLPAVAALAVPLFDTMLVAVARLRAGRPVWQGGRDHSSHRLVRLGLPERGAVLVLCGLGAASGALALLLHAAPGVLAYAAAGGFALGLGVLGACLGRVDVYEQKAGSGGAQCGHRATDVAETPGIA